MKSCNIFYFHILGYKRLENRCQVQDEYYETCCAQFFFSLFRCLSPLSLYTQMSYSSGIHCTTSGLLIYSYKILTKWLVVEKRLPWKYGIVKITASINILFSLGTAAYSS